MEYLTRILRRMSDLADFKYHPMCKAAKLTHLIFVDDLMVFYKGDTKSIKRVLEALKNFSVVTSLEANL